MKGTVVTGDAIFTQRDLSKRIMDEGGDYIWTVKDNQKTFGTGIENTFQKDVFFPQPAGARIRRERITKGVSTVETICLITSLSRVRANAAALLEIARSHCSVENGVHRVRDVTLGEDACTVASGAAPQVLAALINAVLALFRQNKITKVARALRKFNSDLAGTAESKSCELF
jgi:predicted transposase YbfD/YdcC